MKVTEQTENPFTNLIDHFDSKFELVFERLETIQTARKAEEFLTEEMASDQLDVSTKTLREWRKSGEIPPGAWCRKGRRVYYIRSKLIETS